MSLTRSICSFLISSKDKLDAMMSIIYQEEPRKAKKKKIIQNMEKDEKECFVVFYLFIFYFIFWKHKIQQNACFHLPLWISFYR